MSYAKLKLEIVSYDESEDTFQLQQVESNIEETTVDLDVFSMPAFVVACLVGHFDEPHTFIGQVIEINTPN